jgi:hypothetical protein
VKSCFAAIVCTACFAGEAGVTMTDTVNAVALTSVAPLELDGPRISWTPGTVALLVERIEDPAAQGFSITLAVQAEAGWIDAGSVTPYPPGQGGTFLIELPDAAGAALTRNARLRLSLVPVNAPLAEPLKVVIPKLTWSAAHRH